VWFTYLLAKSFVHVSPTPQSWLGELKLYLICVGACAVLAWFLGTELGTNTENQDDPIFGDSETIVDYVPTNEQRSTHALVVFLCLVIPATLWSSRRPEGSARERTNAAGERGRRLVAMIPDIKTRPTKILACS